MPIFVCECHLQLISPFPDSYSNSVTQATGAGGDVCAPSSFAFTTSAPKAPGAATNFALAPGSVTSTGATVTWTAASVAGDPPEDYYVKCWVGTGGSNCNSLNPAFTFGPVPRGGGGALQQALTGLTPNTDYRCFLGARNAATSAGADVCATTNPVTFTLPQAPGAVTDFALVDGSVTSSSADVQWTAPAIAGVPAEDYYVNVYGTPSGITCNSQNPIYAFGPVSRDASGNLQTLSLTGLPPYAGLYAFLGARNAATATGQDVCATNYVIINTLQV